MNNEWMQNVMRMYSSQMAQMNPMFPMNTMMNPMEYFAMANNFNQMFLNSLGNMSTMNQQSKNFDFTKKPDTSRVDEVFNKNANDLNKFYQFLNDRNRDLNLQLNTSVTVDTARPQGEGGQLNTRQERYENQNDQDDLSKNILPPNLTQPKDHNDFFGDTIKSSQYEGELPNRSRRQESSSFTDRPVQSAQQQASTTNYDDRPIKGAQGYQYGGDSQIQNPDDRPIRGAPGYQYGGGSQTQNPDDRPIRPAQSNQMNVDDKPVQSARNVNNFDDMPIKTNNNYNNYDDRSGRKSHNSRNDRSRTEPNEEEEDNRRQVYHDPFDDIPIVTKSKRFEELLEEQLKQNPQALSRQSSSTSQGRKEFLKRGSGFLSSAALRQSRPQTRDQKENISGFDDASPFNSTSRANRIDTDQSQGDHSKRPGKEPKKFLAKGAGKGGGKGNAKDNVTPNLLARKGSLNETTSNTEKLIEDFKSQRAITPAHQRVPSKGLPETTFDRINNAKYNSSNQPSSAKKKDKLQSPEADDHFEDSFDKEYNMEKYMKSNSAKKGKKTPDSYKSPNYQFDDEEEFQDDNSKNVSDFRSQSPFALKKAQSDNLESSTKKQIVEKAKKELTANSAAITIEGDEKIQKYVQDKLDALNSEIAKFKMENERVKKVRQKHEEMLQNLQKEIEQWNKQKEKERKELEDLKAEELKRIRQEKKEADKQHKSIQNQSNKKEREEIEALKQSLAKLQEELQAKDKKNKAMIDNLKKQVEDLTAQNSKLHEELKYYEQLRIKGALPGSDKGFRPSSQGQPKTSATSAPKYSSYRKNEEEEEEQEEENQEDEEQAREEDDDDDNKAYNENDVIHEEEEEEEDDDDRHKHSRYSSNRSSHSNTKSAPNFPNNKIIQSADFGKRSPITASPARKSDKGMNLSTISTKSESTAFRTVDSSTPKKSTSTAKGYSANKTTMSFQEAEERITNTNEYKFDANPYYQAYLSKKNDPNKIINQTVASDGKIQRSYADGKKEVIFHNGVKREVNLQKIE